MKRIARLTCIALLVLLFLTAIAFAVLQPPAPMSLPERGFTLHSVVLLVPGQSRSGPVDVQIEGQQITDIRPAAGPVSAYVLPGLANAHIHGPMIPLPGQEQLYAFLHLYHGVTLARLAAGTTSMRDAIATGSYPGPRIVSCGPFLDGNNPQWRNSLVVTDEHSAEEALRKVVADGYDCVKVYDNLTPEASRAIYQYAQQYQLPVIGHVPWRVDFTDAWIDDRQHLVGWAPLDKASGSSPAVRRLLNLEALDQQRVQQLIDAARVRQFSLTPTMITLQRKFALQHYKELQDSSVARLLPRYYRNQLWHGTRGLVSSRLLSDAEHERFRRLYPKAENAIKMLYNAGVELHSGTDSPAEFIVPGAGLLEELHLLANAGLSAEQVLEISSVTTSRYLAGEEYGQLQVGSPADFVVYAKDPTLDLNNLNTRKAVIRAGRYYSRNQLEQQLQSYQRWFDSPLYQLISELIIGTGLTVMNALAP